MWFAHGITPHETLSYLELKAPLEVKRYSHLFNLKPGVMMANLLPPLVTQNVHTDLLKIFCFAGRGRGTRKRVTSFFINS